MNRQPIGIDIDDTVADFSRAALAVIHQNADPYARLEDWTGWDIGACFGPKADDAVHAAMRDLRFWRSVPEIPGAVREVNRLAHYYQIVFVTSRVSALHTVTVDWLRHHEIIFDDLWCVPSERKIEVAYQKNFVAFVDDRQTVAEQMAAAGIVSGMLARPWNQGGQGILRVPNWTSLGLGLAWHLGPTWPTTGGK